MPDAPVVILPAASGGSPPSAPTTILAAAAGGSPPGAPGSVLAVVDAELESVTLTGATGSGIATINGTHLVAGTYGGKKCFGGVPGAPVIGWDGTRWEIQPLGGGAAHIAGTGAVPADGSWTNVLATGTIVGVYTPGVAAPESVLS